MGPVTLKIDPGDYDDTDALNTVARLAEWWQLLVDQDRDRRLDDLSAQQDEAAATLLDTLNLRSEAGALTTRLESARRYLSSHAWTAIERRAVDHLLTEGLNAVHQAGRLLHRDTPSLQGVVSQISRSDGGVPKQPVPQVEISSRGLVGDRQRTRVHHGRPWQALCLWSAEVIEALRRQGHPIYAGAAGENVTVAGFDWAHVRPGMQMAIGGVVAELSMWAEPCRHNAQWFSDSRFGRIHADQGPVSRVYATVVRPGLVRQGDAVMLIP
jgi:MOSC domain-containing protein YiiM